MLKVLKENADITFSDVKNYNMKEGVRYNVRSNMEEIREQQIEALHAAYDYNKKLSKALTEIVLELRGAEKEDTKEYLDKIMEGTNWIIQVVNGTLSLINEKEERISKEEINDIIIKLNAAFSDNNYSEIAEVIEKGILPFINNVSAIAKDIVGIEEN